MPSRTLTEKQATAALRSLKARGGKAPRMDRCVSMPKSYKGRNLYLCLHKPKNRRVYWLTW